MARRDCRLRTLTPLPVCCTGNEGRKRNDEEGIDPPPVPGGVGGRVRDHSGGAVRAHGARSHEAARGHRRAGDVPGRRAAQACHKAGYPFGIGLGTTADSVDTAGAIFRSFGAALVDANENVTVKTDAVRQALDYYERLAQFFPPDAPSWDDASNNKWLVAGRGALIMNPPSAWAVAKRDAPQIAEQLTHGMPAGPLGRFAPFIPNHWAIWNFSKNKSAAKSLLAHLSQPSAIEKLVVASGGYDVPSFSRMKTLKVWAEEGPPKGTLYHYPNPYNHQILWVAAAPSPPKIAQQIYAQGIMTKMTVRHLQGEPMEATLAWAEAEVEGFMRS
jgi:hypothetical protein